MKKIIKGKVYDTETAHMVADWSSDYAVNDFHYYAEELYRKKTGEFFLYGIGNAASPYSRSCGQNEWCGDEKIVPISFEEAQEWLENKGTAEQYAEVFGMPQDDESTVVLGLAVSAAAAAKLKREAAKNGITQGAQLERWIMEGK